MPILDTVVVITSLLWRDAVWRYSFYAAPGDTLLINVKARGSLDAVYFGEFGKRPVLSEIYTDSVGWRYVSDTLKPYTLELHRRALYSRVKVRVRILRRPASGWEDFNTRLRIVKVRVPYADTLWDTTYRQIDRWEIFMPPNSDIFFANTYGKSPTFSLEGPTAGVLIFLSPLRVDDSLRFKYGEYFLENPFYRQEVCKLFRYGHLELYILDHEEYENAKAGYPFKALERFLGVEVGCFTVQLQEGTYAFVLRNRGDETQNVVVRIVALRLVPVVVTRYKVIERPSR